MPRTTEEWIGKNADQAIPPRVKDRICQKYGNRCAVCELEINEKRKPAFDHIIALVNGGENRESNLQLLCMQHHKDKTRQDVKLKAKIARVRQKHLGLTSARKKIQSRGFPRSEPQRTASRPIRRQG